MTERIVDGVTYILVPTEQIRKYIIGVCEKEWDPNDFITYNKDLYGSEWKLEEIDLAKIIPNKTLLKSDVFQKDLRPRLRKQKELYATKKPIPPLILRGSDLLIFDGYARYHLLKELGVKKCLAYVGYTSRNKSKIVYQSQLSK